MVKDRIAEAICSNAIDGANRRGGNGNGYVVGVFASGLKYKFYGNDPQRILCGYKNFAIKYRHGGKSIEKEKKVLALRQEPFD